MKEFQVPGEPPAQHREHPALKNMKFLRFFELCRIFGLFKIRIQGPDSDKLTHLRSGSLRIGIHRTGLILPIIGRNMPDILLV
jgi:hypothetical protein